MIDEENGQTRKTKDGKRYQKKQKGKKGKIAGTIVAIILILLVILLGVGTGMVAGKLSKINFDKLDKSDLGVNEDLYNEVADNVSKEEFEKIKNVALFGIDGGRSDAIMIASINQVDKINKYSKRYICFCCRTWKNENKPCLCIWKRTISIKDDQF